MSDDLEDTQIPTSGAKHFDASAWSERLLEINPWARQFASFDGTDFDCARERATLARLMEGQPAWTRWGHAMSKLRREIVERQLWTTKQRDGRTLADNDVTHSWIALAKTVFGNENNKYTFEQSTAFAYFYFPWDVHFDGTIFQETVDFHNATFSHDTSFKDASFRGEAKFGWVHFSGKVDFSRAIFSKGAAMYSAQFEGNAQFREAVFEDYAAFGGCTFGERANFFRCKFRDGTEFRTAKFEGSANFDGMECASDAAFDDAEFDLTFFKNAIFPKVCFNGAVFRRSSWFLSSTFEGTAQFERVRFEGATSFKGSRFLKDATFEGADGAATFSLEFVTFNDVPNFYGATFRALRLDNLVTPRYSRLGWNPDKDASARYRDLKRRAGEAQDRDRELEFFAQEMRTARFHRYRRRPFFPAIWEWRFWFG